jgi:hypothetical protein
MRLLTDLPVGSPKMRGRRIVCSMAAAATPVVTNKRAPVYGCRSGMREESGAFSE